MMNHMYSSKGTDNRIELSPGTPIYRAADACGPEPHAVYVGGGCAFLLKRQDKLAAGTLVALNMDWRLFETSYTLMEYASVNGAAVVDPVVYLGTLSRAATLSTL